jgi:hypothetical protein
VTLDNGAWLVMAAAAALSACSSETDAADDTDGTAAEAADGSAPRTADGTAPRTDGGAPWEGDGTVSPSAETGADGAPSTRIPPMPEGSPSVLVGWYSAGWGRADSSSDEYFESMRSAGVNFFVTNQPSTFTDGNALLAYLDKAAARGMKVVLGLPSDALVDTDPSLGKLRTFVTAVKDHPALWGYNVDEPDGGSVSAAQMASAYAVLKSVDSTHPLENKVLSSGYNPYCDFTGQASAYAPSMDLGGRDVYPIGPNDDPVKYNYYPLHPPSDEFTIAVPKDPHGAGGAFVATLIADDCATQAKVESKLPPIIDLQGVGTAAGYRDPTYLETRYMLFTTIIRDVSGVAFWVDYKAFDTPVLRTVNAVIREASQVGTYLRAGTFGDPGVAVSEPKVGYRAARVGKTMVVVAVNESEKGDQPLSGTLPSPPPTFPAVTFTLPAGLVATRVEVVLDGLDVGTGSYAARTLPLSRTAQGRYAFADAFSPYAVHIYGIDVE